MPTKSLQFKLRHPAVLLLMLGSLTAQADGSIDQYSPYRLNIEPVKMPQLHGSESGQSASTDPQAYQLDYKYRDPNKPPRMIKAISPEKQVVPELYTYSNSANEKLAKQPYSGEIALAANAASLDPALVHAVIYVESRYRHTAVSPKGAIGLMQVMPDTAARYGISDVGNSPKVNLKAGTLYLRDLLRMFDNHIDLALAAYNAGEGAVMNHARQIPPYRETRLYVTAVLAKYNEWRNLQAIGVLSNLDNGISAELLPAKRVKVEYLSGTSLALTDTEFSPKY